jgi:hypothetical protein
MAHSDGCDAPGLSDEVVSGVTAMVGDGRPARLADAAGEQQRENRDRVIVHSGFHSSGQNGGGPLAHRRRRDPPDVHVLPDALQLGDAGLGLEGRQQLPHALGVMDRI